MAFLVNGSFLIDRPTGITAYTQSILPHLALLSPVVLSGRSLDGYSCYSIPNNLTPDFGSRGHVRRLFWTQWELPHIYSNLQAKLLYSPVPELPLGSPGRYAIMVHDSIPLRFPQPRSALTLYHRYYLPLVLARSDRIICNSEATARDLAAFYGVTAGKLFPIPLACDRERFFPRPEVAASNYFLYVGRPDPHKNLARLLSAFAALPQQLELELWLAGPNDRRYTPQLQQQAEALGISDRVQFLGYLLEEKLPDILRGAIALVFPSRWEGFGLPVLEAMSCGTPVITSNVASLPEVTGDAAILVDPENTAELTAAMHAVATETEMRSRLREKGLQRASQFSWEQTGRATVEVLKPLL